MNFINNINYCKYLESEKWKNFREEVLKRDNYKCTKCGKTENLHIHHISYDNIWDEKLEDVITLCDECHEKEHSTKRWNKSKNKATKEIIDEMIDSGSVDVRVLYQYLRKTKVINAYGQIKTYNIYKLDDDLENVLINEGVLFAHVYKCIKLAHPFTHILKKNHMTQIKTWGELWDSISCSNIRTQQKVKKFLEENKLIKCVPIKKDNGTTQNLFVLNPYLYKNSSHAGQFACIVWQECAKPNININFYAYMWLVSQDCIILDENTNYNEIVENFFVNKSKKMKK